MLRSLLPRGFDFESDPRVPLAIFGLMALLLMATVAAAVYALLTGMSETISVITAGQATGQDWITMAENLAFSPIGRGLVVALPFGVLVIALRADSYTLSRRAAIALLVGIAIAVTLGIITSRTAYPTDQFAPSYVQTASSIFERTIGSWIGGIFGDHPFNGVAGGIIGGIVSAVITLFFAGRSRRSE